MEELAKKIETIVDLIKAMMASIKQPSLSAGNNSLRLPKQAAVAKAPGVAPASQKDPMKVAQQLQDPDAKKAATKQVKEQLSFSKNGQWTLK